MLPSHFLVREHLHLELIASRVKDACWEAVNGQKGQAISGMKAGMQVLGWVNGQKGQAISGGRQI
jgi:hypothetical protein